jgi:hypothetical protein
MISQSRNELVRSIAQLRKLAIHPSTSHDLSTAVVRARSALTKVQGEILSDAIKKGRANKGLLRALARFNTAIEGCNKVDLLSDDPDWMNREALALALLATANFSVIEAYLFDLEHRLK